MPVKVALHQGNLNSNQVLQYEKISYIFLQWSEWDSTIYILSVALRNLNWAASCLQYVHLSMISVFPQTDATWLCSPRSIQQLRICFCLPLFFPLRAVFSLLCCPTLHSHQSHHCLWIAVLLWFQGRVGYSTTGMFVSLGSGEHRPECTCVGFCLFFFVMYLCEFHICVVCELELERLSVCVCVFNVFISPWGQRVRRLWSALANTNRSQTLPPLQIRDISHPQMESFKQTGLTLTQT